MILNSPYISGSITVTGNATIQGTISGSVSGTASNATTASYAATASSADNLLVRNTLTAQTLVVQTITSSVDFVTGSTRFGSIAANTHQFTGSVSMNPGGLFVSSSGLVGIGTTSPLGSSVERTLHLSDGGAGYTTLYVTNGANTLRGIFAISNAASTISVGTQTNHNFRIVTNDTPRVYITNGGSVGIGTDSPTEILQANGSIRALQTNSTGIAQFAADASNTTSLRCGLATFGSSAVDVLLGIGRASNSFLYKNGGTLVIGTEGAYPLILSAGDAERMRISNTGIVTKPFQPAFRAGRSSSYNPGANTPIVFNSTSGFGFNVGGHYNTSNGRFTAPVTGIYNFNACIIWESVGSGQAMDDAFEVKVNGTTAAYSFRRAAYVANTTGIGGYYVDHATVLLNLTAGQYVEIQNRYNLTVHGNQNYCYFTGYLVG